jgi:hypothetical protein
MPIYIYQQTCPLTNGLTNQLIILISFLESLSSLPIHDKAIAIGSFFTDYNDLKKTCSFFDVFEMSVFEKSFPTISFLDYHHSKNIYSCSFDSGISTNLKNIISQKYKCPFTIYSNNSVNYIWKDSIIIGNHKPKTGWNLHSSTFINIMKTLSFKIKVSSRNILPSQTIHLMHLRNERDAIKWWSKQNHMSMNEFEEHLNQQYIRCVKMFIPKTDILIIITGRSSENPVIESLKNDKYNIEQCVKIHQERELSAIEDLLFAEKNVNGVFIGCKNGSTFSKCLLEHRVAFTNSIHLDLDNIQLFPIVSIKN